MKTDLAFVKSEFTINKRHSAKNPRNTLISRVLVSSRRFGFIFITLELVSGCAGTYSPQITNSTSTQLAPRSQKYTLTQEEMKLDCRKLTGSAQVKILSLRGADLKDKPSSASQTLGFLTSSLFGTHSPSEPGHEMRVLLAYNDRLKELGCKSFDLSKELANRPSGPLPEATIEENTKIDFIQ